LGELTLEMVQRVRTVVVDGGQQDLDALISRDKQIDQLESSILIYIGKLSQLEHTDDQGREMVGLAQIASTLEAVSDLVTTNLASLGHQRLAEGIDLARLKDDRTSEFADAVIRNLEQAIAAVGEANQSQAAQVLAAKKSIQALAESARQGVFAKLQLSERKDVVSFSLATDMIGQFNQIAHFARQIARIVEEWTHEKSTGSKPAGTSASNKAARDQSKQDLKTLREKRE
jgi:phosphate:Na+ symporter